MFWKYRDVKRKIGEFVKAEKGRNKIKDNGVEEIGLWRDR